MSCKGCGSGRARQERRDQPLADLRIVARGIRAEICADCGALVSEAWPRPAELTRLVIHALVSKPGRLAPGEFRWLRKRLGWRGAALARRFGVAPETVSRWERGKARVSPLADRLLRAAVAAAGKAPLFDVDSLAEIDDADDAPLEVAFELSPIGWQAVGSARVAS